MSKTYKGYELIKAIADGEIKEGTILIFESTIAEQNIKVEVIRKPEGLQLYKRDRDEILPSSWLFNSNIKLIEDEIDIQSIEELKYIAVMKSVDEKVSRKENLRRIDKTQVDCFYKINDIVKQQNKILEAVKQLDRNKEDKQC